MNYARNSYLNKQLPAYLGFFVLLIALGLTIFLSGNTLFFVTKATVGSNPKNIQISNITGNSFTISYITDAPAIGTISYGTDNTALSEVALDDREQEASGSAEHQIHFITVKNLLPSTTYYYTIISGSQKADNNGSPFQITTTQLPQSPPSNPTLTGTISLSDGSIPTEGIIYITNPNSQQLATLINPDGSYQISLNGFSGTSASTTSSLTPDTVLQLQAVTAMQQSTAKILVSQAGQVPKIILPQNYDFTLGPQVPSTETSPVASTSGFPALATPAPVTSPEISTPTEQQAFKDQQPLFQGRALPNTEVDITIQSQQEISAKLQSDDSGSWQFRPPVTLAPGKHTITITSPNVAGIMQTITRSFTVYAQGSKFVEPSVSPVASPTATPSATLAPTVTTAPKATPTPTQAITPTTHPITPGPTKGPMAPTGSSAVITGIVAGVSVLGIGALLIFLTIV